MMFTKTRSFNPSFISLIDEDRTYHGNFWTPDSPGDKVSGVIYLKKEGGITLKLIGMFKKDSSEILGLQFADHEIMLGTLVPGLSPITLVNCVERERQSPYIHNTNEGATQRYKVQYIILGLLCQEKEDLKFPFFEFSTTYLSDWMDMHPIELKIKPTELVVKSPKQKKTMSIVGQQVKLSLTSWSTTSLGSPYNSSESAAIGVEVESITLDEFNNGKLKSLFDLIQFGSSHLNSLTSFRVSKTVGEATYEVIFGTDFRQITKSKAPLHHSALFRLSDFEGLSESLVLSWLQVYSKIEHVFKLYFGARHIGFQFPVSKFLNMVQALESYHADRNDSETVKHEKKLFLQLKLKLKNAVPDTDVDLRAWVDSELLYRPTLRARLFELVNETGSVFDKIIQDKEVFINRIVHSRNYYTHYDPSKKEKAAIGIELDALTHSMTLLLDYHLLRECKIDESTRSKLFERNDYFNSIVQVVEEGNFWAKK